MSFSAAIYKSGLFVARVVAIAAACVAAASSGALIAGVSHALGF
jgi:hypothetical protein